MRKENFEYKGQYIRESEGGASGFKWVYVPREKVYFLHENTLSSGIMMGIFEEDEVIYLMSHIYDEAKEHIKCALANVKRSNYNNIYEPENDKKINKSGHSYYEMDSIYYCEWCTRER